ncbi:MAG: TPM domain-containing protein [Bacteroidales bacterium]|nr:TPM domain-containing protein [Bacteroidales bacterium]
MRRRILHIAHLFLLWAGVVSWSVLPVRAAGSDIIPAAPVPPRLVNDYAGILGREAFALERVLRAFNDSTSNQITIVTLHDLGGYAASQAAYEIGERWGVGNAKYNNGVVILIKPKNENGSGEVFIAPGYGLEAALPDAVCKRIIEDEMIPYFRQNEYTQGVLAGLRVIMPLASGEISAKEYMPEEGVAAALALIFAAVIIFIVLVIAAAGKKNNRNKNNGGNDQENRGLKLALWATLLNMGNSSGRSQGGFGGGNFGGGGFGGFGGGSFGGGGAGGKW